MKLYGLMRADGIFPNAVTLGQYTKAIAEGYSHVKVDDSTKVGMQVVISSHKHSKQVYFSLDVLDSNLLTLEESGLKWKSGNSPLVKTDLPTPQSNNIPTQVVEEDLTVTISPSKTFDTANTQRSMKSKRSWLPVSCSSSFLPNSKLDNHPGRLDRIRLFALWSRTAACKACTYIPLDEEIQSGWDVMQTKLEIVDTVACPRCAESITPLICYKEMTVNEIIESESTTIGHDNLSSQVADLNDSGISEDTDLQDVPPQLESIIKNGPASDSRTEQDQPGCVAYLSPLNLRITLEGLVLEYGEAILERGRLRMVNPEVFFNLWWYAARFSLPLPLSVKSCLIDDNPNIDTGSYDCCAFASWDRSLALEGCRSAAKAIVAAQTISSSPDPLLCEKLFDNPNTDIPLLSFFNLQNYAQIDWDHPDFSESEYLLSSFVYSSSASNFFNTVRHKTIVSKNSFSSIS